MKALHFNQHGELANLRYGDIHEPRPGPGSVLVRVRAAALNHLDLWVLRGWPGLKLEMPHVGGADIAGEIAELGNDVQGFQVGEPVALMPGFVPTGADDEFIRRGEESLSPAYNIFGEQIPGGFAEFVHAPQSALMRIPKDLSFAHAAAPLLVATTAWRMLKKRAALARDETVLIVGAGGGVNSFSIWLAKDLGARVIALTSSKQKAAKVSQLGADEVINYREIPDWSREVRRLTGKRGVDVVVDNVGAATYPQSLLSLARGGRLVTVGNTSGPEVTFDNRLVFGKQLSIIGSTMGSRSDAQEAAQYAWTKPLAQLIDRELPLAQGREGYAALEKGSQFGKILLIP